MRNNKGFTLLEMLAVMAILGIITTFGIVYMQSSLESTEIAACQNKLELVAIAEKRFFATQNRHSLEFENLGVIDSESELVDMGYLDFSPNENIRINVEIDSNDPLIYRLYCSEYPDTFILQSEDEYRRDYFLTYTEEGEDLPHEGDEDDIDLEDPEDIVSENVFVYGTSIIFYGSEVIGDNASVYLSNLAGTSDSVELGGGSLINVTNIYSEGSIELSGGSASLGSELYPGEIHVDNDVLFGSGTRYVYGDLYINGDFHIGQAWAYRDIYVNGNFMIYYDGINRNMNQFTRNFEGHVYYTGELLTNAQNKYLNDLAQLSTKVDTVEPVDLPDVSMPSLRDDSWYQSNGYNYTGTNPNLVDNLKVFSDSYFSDGWAPDAENVIIVAKEGDITITGFWSTLTGILYAPNGKVTFGGERFEGLVVSRDGFHVPTGGTVVEFRSAIDFVSEENLPFVP